MSGSFDLTVSVPADEWAYNQRRLKYLETLLLRVVRDSQNIQEGFTAAELAARRLPGMPTTPDAMSRRARRERWPSRKARFRSTWFHAYHVTSLPARAFDALIARILAMPGIDAVVPILPGFQEAAPEIAAPVNTAPAWVLPLMRIMKTETAGDITEAWDMLPERLPPGVALPSVDEAAIILVHLGLVNGI